MTRIAGGVCFGAVAAAGAVGIGASGRTWLRVLISPAWRTGGLASGSIDSPNLPVVLLTAFVCAFAVGFFGWGAIQPRRRPDATPARRLATSLLLLLALVALELRWYPSIATWLFEGAGGQGGAGSSYLLVLATRLIPGAALFLILATVVSFLVFRYRPLRTSAAVLALWVCHVLVLLASVAWYFSPAGPEGIQQ